MSDVYSMSYEIESGKYNSAGEISKQVKSTLVKFGIDSILIRKIAVCSYEAEINVIIHSLGGKMTLSVGVDDIVVEIDDIGPGIENIELAMSEGYSTASPDARRMGFGAGMGLPNMKATCDKFSITSSKEDGTHIKMVFYRSEA